MTVTTLDNSVQYGNDNSLLGIEVEPERQLENFVIDNNFVTLTNEQNEFKSDSSKNVTCNIEEIIDSNHVVKKDKQTPLEPQRNGIVNNSTKNQNGNCCEKWHVGEKESMHQCLESSNKFDKSSPNGTKRKKDALSKRGGSLDDSLVINECLNSNENIQTYSAPCSPTLRNSTNDKVAFVNGLTQFIGRFSIKKRTRSNNESEDKRIRQKRTPTIKRLCDSVSKLSSPLYKNWLKNSISASDCENLSPDTKSSDCVRPKPANSLSSLAECQPDEVDNENISEVIFHIDPDTFDDSDESDSKNSDGQSRKSIRSCCDSVVVDIEDKDLEAENETFLSIIGTNAKTNNADAAESLNIPKGSFKDDRRSSRWSATILFVSSQVHTVINLAEFCPPDKYETMPDSGEPGADDKSKNMNDPRDDLELLDVKTRDNGQNYQSVPDRTETMPMNGAVSGSKDQDTPGNSPGRDKGDEDTQLLKSKDKLDDPEIAIAPTADDRPREQWGRKLDFMLAVIGYAVDLSNVWRFPYLCYKNGGGAFIIPYFTVLIFGAVPIFFMELSMGQFHREGPIQVWKIVPIFKGIGYAACFMAYIVAFYYNVVIGWSFYYLFSSFTSNLPWTTCNHSWNSLDCWQSDWVTDNSTNSTTDNNASVSATFEFFERGVLNLHRSSGLENLGPIQWQLALCTLLTFIILYFSLWKGVKSSGKVVWITATLPYLILTILLIRGLLLPGSGEGIRYFIQPTLYRLGDAQVWIDAAVQIFFSIGAGFGTHIAYASYNKFHNNCYRDCLFTAGVNSFTSIFSGFVVFSYLGYMAQRQNKPISDVAQEGPGLVFIVYPEAIATLPGSTVWAVFFFLMLITLGMDSAFGGLESPLTGLNDQFAALVKTRWSRELLTFIVVFSAFFCSLPCTTWGGMYVFKILDTFAAGTSIVFAVLCQVIAVAWFYGIDQLCSDIEKMTGYRPGMYWRLCWKFLSPTFLIIIVISSILHYEPLVYKGGIGKYVYPYYANVVGWLIALSTMGLIPLYAIYKLLTTKGTLRERIAICISPVWEHEAIRQNNVVKRFQRRHWMSL